MNMTLNKEVKFNLIKNFLDVGFFRVTKIKINKSFLTMKILNMMKFQKFFHNLLYTFLFKNSNNTLVNDMKILIFSSKLIIHYVMCI